MFVPEQQCGHLENLKDQFSFGAVGCTDVCLLSHVMEAGESSPVELKAEKLDELTQDDPRSSLWVVSGRNHFVEAHFFMKEKLAG